MAARWAADCSAARLARNTARRRARKPARPPARKPRARLPARPQTRAPANRPQTCPPPKGRPATPRSDACAAIADGKLYLFGGWGANYTVPPRAEALDLATGRWAPLPDGMTPRGDCEAAALPAERDCVLVIGGWGDAVSSAAECWRPKKGAWERMANMTRARGGSRGAVRAVFLRTGLASAVAGLTCAVMQTSTRQHCSSALAAAFGFCALGRRRSQAGPGNPTRTIQLRVPADLGPLTARGTSTQACPPLPFP